MKGTGRHDNRMIEYWNWVERDYCLVCQSIRLLVSLATAATTIDFVFASSMLLLN